MVFSSRDENCKSPYGAVLCGTAVRFTLRPDPAEGFASCSLLTYDEFADARGETALSPCADGFTGTFPAPETATLIWYTFRFSRPDGSCVTWGKGGYGDETPYQLTVYRDPHTPDWFGRGVTYQIFPDRFCRLSVPDPTGIFGGRWVHRSWDDAPVHQPDGDGEIRNCDFFGGSLDGITSKLDYLASLSVTTLYLNPIFAAASNHRYDTADYLSVDPLLGTEDDFRRLCAEAEKRGIRVMLDGVFNHTGSDSRYFNAYGTFPGTGAAQSPESPYYDWYSFRHYPDSYEAWWGVRTLPAVNENTTSYRRFIISDPDSVVRHWLRAGAAAWRLDVADELPDDFIAEIRRAMTEEKADSFLLGEVWEDASNKIAYSRRRRYLLGDELGGVMNYPFRTAALNYLRGGDAAAFRETMEELRENYPRSAYYSALNLLGTHDTPRILTALGADTVPDSKDERANYRLSSEELQRGLARLRLGAMLLYCFPGSPTVFYGDEVGMQGFEDPLNRGTYPWGHENTSLLDFFRTLGKLRKERPSLQNGEIRYLAAEAGLLILERRSGDEITVCALNAGDTPRQIDLPRNGDIATDAVSRQRFLLSDHTLHLTLPPCGGAILI